MSLLQSAVSASQRGVVADGQLAGLRIIIEESQGERLMARLEGIKGVYLLIDATHVELEP